MRKEAAMPLGCASFRRHNKAWFETRSQKRGTLPGANSCPPLCSKAQPFSVIRGTMGRRVALWSSCLLSGSIFIASGAQAQRADPTDGADQPAEATGAREVTVIALDGAEFHGQL